MDQFAAGDRNMIQLFLSRFRRLSLHLYSLQYKNLYRGYQFMGVIYQRFELFERHMKKVKFPKLKLQRSLNSCKSIEDHIYLAIQLYIYISIYLSIYNYVYLDFCQMTIQLFINWLLVNTRSYQINYSELDHFQEHQVSTF